MISYVINTHEDGLAGCIPEFGNIDNQAHEELENHMARSIS